MKRKGFTLIELLAVIVILAIIALIAVPIVMNIIGKANKSAFKDTGYGILKAGELYYAEHLLEVNGMENDVEFKFPEMIGNLEIKGALPSGGNMIVSKEGKIAIAISNGKYCVRKGYTDNDITIDEDIENCKTKEKVNFNEITNIELSETDIVLNVGESKSITVTYEPLNATLKDINWTSKDEAIVKVNNKGEITGVKGGTTKVTAETMDGSGIKREVNVTVKQTVTKLEVNTTSVSVINGGTYTVIATITPADAYNKTLSWTSSDDSIAKVDSNGLITGIKGGTATITVATTDGSDLNKTVEVTVRQQVTNVTLSPTSVTIDAGESASINATVIPADAYMKGLKWESSNTAIATVSGGTITGISSGTATIKATTIDGSNISKSVSVTVKQRVTSLSLNPSNVIVDVGQTSTIVATITPTNATNKTLSWSSSNTSIATVNSSGVITGISKGSVTITATTTDGSNISKTVSVSIKQSNPNISSSNTCIKDNSICPNGTIINVKVNSSETYTFYVIKDTGEDLTLIMNKNLGTGMIWISQADYTSAGGTSYGLHGNSDKGPLTALKTLEQRTSGWSNVPTMTYTVKDDGGGNKYSPITRSNVRSRMLTYTEANNLGCTTNPNSCPSYLYINTSVNNTDAAPMGYWLSSAYNTNVNNGAFTMRYAGTTQSVYIDNTGQGVRPIITMTKNL